MFYEENLFNFVKIMFDISQTYPIYLQTIIWRIGLILSDIISKLCPMLKNDSSNFKL